MVGVYGNGDDAGIEMDILTREELQDLFVNSEGEMIIKVTLTSPDGLMNLYHWLKGKSDPIPDVECNQLMFRTFNVDDETTQLTNQVIAQVAAQVSQRINQLKLVTINRT